MKCSLVFGGLGYMVVLYMIDEVVMNKFVLEMIVCWVLINVLFL